MMNVRSVEFVVIGRRIVALHVPYILLVRQDPRGVMLAAEQNSLRLITLAFDLLGTCADGSH
jgi:hypothetical protein